MADHKTADVARRLSFQCPPTLLERVVVRYAEPHRRYHTWAHILACFDARDALTSAASPAVDLALLFHDAIYEPLRQDNEARSAALLVEEGRRAWLDDRMLSRAQNLVLATAHGSATHLGTEEASIVLDADLSILGGDETTFDEYERLVRQEYAQVEEAAYSAGRRAILSALLARATIFVTRVGRARWEEPARRNLARSLAKLAR